MTAIEADVVETQCPACMGQRNILARAGTDPDHYRLVPCPTCLGTGTNWQIITTPPLTPPARPPSPSG
jgi:hypothetical protein